MTERDWLLVSCVAGNHEWKHIGGCNAGCGNDCACSVPVHECRRCGDCDYGDNAEAVEARRRCAENSPND